MINPNGRVGKLEEDLKELTKVEDIQRRIAVANLAASLSKASKIAHGKDLETAKKALTQQMYRIGEGTRFYSDLGIIDEDTEGRARGVCENIQRIFYRKYNQAKAFD